jgi:fructose-1,6-bisphosphatase/inositol monophosphatase family enzyme
VLDAYLNLNVSKAPDRGEKVVDLAASSLVVSEAGGVLFDHLGNEIELSADLTERTNVLAAGNRALYEDVLSTLGRDG